MKTYTSEVNHFFKKKVYGNLFELAISPVSWAFESTGGYLGVNLGKILLAAVLWPVLIPAACVTSLLAIGLTIVASLVHGISLMGAAIADCCGEPSVVSSPTL